MKHNNLGWTKNDQKQEPEPSQDATFTQHDVDMLINVLPILQAFARDHPSNPRYDDAHSAYYDIPRLALKIQALIPAPPAPQKEKP